MSAVKYWVWLSSLHDVSPAQRIRLLEHFGSIQELYFATRETLREFGGLDARQTEALMKKDLSPVLKILDTCARESINLITLQDAEYPLRLKRIYDPPVLLYVKGKLPVMDEEVAIGIVGTRKATPYGIKMARRLGYEITRCGGLVVSGLALGIDSAGAEGALRAGGSCVGVVGTAIDKIYPASNAGLFEDVSTVGAVVGEYPPGLPIMSGTFPMRNRIISGLSLGVTIIEAPLRSGSLITANYALEQGRDVFVLPGNADSPNSIGSNELIKDGAKAVTAGYDILCEYDGLYPNKLRLVRGEAARIPQEKLPEPVKSTGAAEPETGESFLKLRVRSTKKEIDKKNSMPYIDLEEQLSNLSETQLKIISVMNKPSMHVDDIIELSELPPAEVLSELTMLQIDGYIIQERGKRFSLNINR